ncbi:MAG TPA: acyloxyacyl hydrolase [Acidobacteriaceae bacterium]|nr:acyloxyacyl hydrolase [Acidobacteriaceae bacterium]
MTLAQSPQTTWTHKYDLGMFGEYSPTSSHMLLGYARQRELVGIGGSLAWRLMRRDSFQLAYLVEVRPMLMESDPTLVGITNPQLGTFQFVPPLVVVDPINPVLFAVFLPGGGAQNYPFTPTYSRRWTYTGGASPVGWKLNGFTHRRIQPEFMGNGGFLISPRDIPVVNSSSFNFTFEVGAGLQWYRTPSQSIQVEIRYHHLSNGNLGTANPGVDSALWKVTYTFGRNHLLH